MVTAPSTLLLALADRFHPQLIAQLVHLHRYLEPPEHFPIRLPNQASASA